jgi:trimethylamine:corrinoid methyltransferase-like protein
MPALIYSEAKMERLYRGALRVLRETGFRIQHDAFLKLFAKRGMRVDPAGQRVYITEFRPRQAPCRHPAPPARSPARAPWSSNSPR